MTFSLCQALFENKVRGSKEAVRLGKTYYVIVKNKHITLTCNGVVGGYVLILLTIFY
jgi:hypothetical protein